MTTFDRAASAPRGLLYLATFNSAERAVITASPQLQGAIRGSALAEWSGIVEQHRAAQRAALEQHRTRHCVPSTGDPEHVRQLQYVAAILDCELPRLASMPRNSGRNDATFRLVCRVGRWAHHGIIARDRLVADVLAACERNGLVHEDGRKAVLDTIESGLARSAGDALPDLGGAHG